MSVLQPTAEMVLQVQLSTKEYSSVSLSLQARKDPTQRSLEARLRNARALAELTKFRLAPFGGVFSALKSLLDDFSGHNVDAAAALVEGAGRFLFRLPESQTRMANMLEVRMQLHRA